MKQIIFNILLALLVAFYICAIAIAAREENRNNFRQYQECKLKTSDLEWCFKQFNPKL